MISKRITDQKVLEGLVRLMVDNLGSHHDLSNLTLTKVDNFLTRKPTAQELSTRLGAAAPTPEDRPEARALYLVEKPAITLYMASRYAPEDSTAPVEVPGWNYPWAVLIGEEGEVGEFETLLARYYGLNWHMATTPPPSHYGC